MKVRIPWGKKPVLAYPIPPAPPTAILVDCFRSAGNLRVFAKGWGDEAAQFAPAAIAATPEQLNALCTKQIPSLRNAIIALVRAEEPRLTESDRERFWQSFRVPMFEQLIDSAGALLAAECEAHDGLHIESTAVEPRAGEILEAAPCGCGKTSPRLIAVERVENLRRVAAYAR